MQVVVQLDDMYGGYFNPDWLYQYHRPLAFLTYFTIAIQLVVPTMLWMKRTRAMGLLLAFVMHAGIDASMNLNMFHWIMITGWLSFLVQPTAPPPVLKDGQEQGEANGADKPVARMKGRPRPPPIKTLKKASSFAKHDKRSQSNASGKSVRFHPEMVILGAI